MTHSRPKKRHGFIRNANATLINDAAEQIVVFPEGLMLPGGLVGLRRIDGGLMVTPLAATKKKKRRQPIKPKVGHMPRRGKL